MDSKAKQEVAAVTKARDSLRDCTEAGLMRTGKWKQRESMVRWEIYETSG